MFLCYNYVVLEHRSVPNVAQLGCIIGSFVKSLSAEGVSMSGKLMRRLKGNEKNNSRIRKRPVVAGLFWDEAGNGIL